MGKQVRKLFPVSDVLIMAAAVADYRLAMPSRIKIKKTKGDLWLRLQKNPDILGEVLKIKKPPQRVIGFAAETDHLEQRALAKWNKKPCDLLVANLVGKPGTGFDSDRNELLVFIRNHSKPVHLKKDLKSRLAEKLLDLIE
jgi:phosphopantothenoylcysteine synthetase/decarboxylase